MKPSAAFALSCLMAVSLPVDLLAQAAAISTRTPPIRFDQVGAVAGKQYSGDGLSVEASIGGALLHCAFQRLNARATSEGLWLTSTANGAKCEPFRIIARTMGRTGSKVLPISGKVEVGEKLVRFIRPSLTEDYSVGVVGVQQDFVIARRPEGAGPVRLELEVDGANAETMADGARLNLADGQRKILYHELKAEDAQGKELTVSMEVLSANRLAVVLDDAAAEYPVRIDPTFSDANWINFGELPGTDPLGTVYAVITDGAGNLYIGGHFVTAGNATASRVAKWDGSSWSALGTGILGPYGNIVYALAISGTNLYAGGSFIFTNASGISATNIAVWNGSSWSAMGAGINGTVYALLASDTNLFVGGSFTVADAVLATNIAQWNGSSWSALDPGMGTAGGDSVYALAVLGTNLYAGGYFFHFNTPNGIAQWNGSSWSSLGSGMNSSVYALAVSGTNLYAGGQFTMAGGLSASGLALWNGSSWSAFNSGLSGSSGPAIPTVYTLAVSATNLYAGGEFVAGVGPGSGSSTARWNGSSWSSLGSGMSGGSTYSPVYALAISGTNVYAGGSFASAGGIAASNIAQWNGSQWSVPSSKLNGWVVALTMSGTNLYVGGQFTTAGGIVASNIVAWNGSSWSALSSGMNGIVRALAMSGTNLCAGGDFTTAAGIAANYVARWNGSSWSALSSGMNGSVRALAVSGTNLYAGGGFSTAGGGAAANIAKWNGNSWTHLGSGMNNTVFSLAISGTNLYAGGAFTNAGGVSANAIAQWNGISWSTLGLGMGINGTSPSVFALALSGTNLYAAGYFTSAGGIPANGVAQWNGSSWSALGSGVGSVYALAASGTNLYAGGGTVARWDGSSWSSSGPGGVYALAVSDTNLFAGCGFKMVNGEPINYLAEAIFNQSSTSAPPVIVTTNSDFGFTNGSSQFGFDVDESGATGQTLLILGSTNLVDWVPLQTNVLGGSLLYFSDPYTTNFPWRFYRAQLLP